MEDYAYAEQFDSLCATRTNYIVLVSVEANRLLRGVLLLILYELEWQGLGYVVEPFMDGGNRPNVGKGAIECLI